MKILFVRHGESVDDIEDRYGGWADYDLTDKGKEQIYKTLEKISDLGQVYEVILSSPLKRALQAAEIISEKLGLDVEVFEYLKERNLNGVLTGMVKSEAKEKYPTEVETHNRWEFVDASEREEDFEERVRKAYKYMSEMGYESVVAVTHGLILRSFFREYLNMNITRIEDGAFALVEETDGNFKVLKVDGIEFE